MDRSDETPGDPISDPPSVEDETDLLEPTLALEEFVVVPDYELIKPIGKGAAGQVWLARQKLSDVLYAIKIIPRGRIQAVELEGVRHYRQRGISHPNLLRLEHMGETPEHVYYVMELADDVTGSTRFDPQHYAPRTLTAELQRRRVMSPFEALIVARDLLEGLNHLHASGLMHRDVKPANVIHAKGKWKLGDVGLVVRDDKTVAQLGTAAYWPPEGVQDRTADLYALGKILYQLVTGRGVKQYPDFTPVDSTLPIDDLGLPEARRIIESACADDVLDRYTSAEVMRVALQGAITRTQQAAKAPSTVPRETERLPWVQRLGAHARARAAMLPLVGLVVAVALGMLWLVRGPDRQRATRLSLDPVPARIDVDAWREAAAVDSRDGRWLRAAGAWATLATQDHPLQALWRDAFRSAARRAVRTRAVIDFRGSGALSYGFESRVAFSSDGLYAVVKTHSRTARIHLTGTGGVHGNVLTFDGRDIHRIVAGRDPPVYAAVGGTGWQLWDRKGVEWSPYIEPASSAAIGSIRDWQIAGGRVLTTWTTQKSPYVRIELWSVKSRGKPRRLRELEERVLKDASNPLWAELTPDGTKLRTLVWENGRGRVRIFSLTDLAAEPFDFDIGPIPAGRQDATTVIGSPDGRWLLVLSLESSQMDGPNLFRVRAFDATTGKPVGASQSACYAVAFASRTGRYACATNNGVRVFDPTTAESLCRIPVRATITGPVELIQRDATTQRVLSFNRDGTQLLILGTPLDKPEVANTTDTRMEPTVSVWAIPTGARLFTVHQEPPRDPVAHTVYGAVFLPRGDRIATFHREPRTRLASTERLRVWKARPAGMLDGYPLALNKGAIDQAAISIDGRWLAVAVSDGVGVFDVRGRRWVANQLWRGAAVASARSSATPPLAISISGGAQSADVRVLILDGNGRIQLHTATGKRLALPTADRPVNVTAINITRDGRWIACGGNTGKVVLLRTTPPDVVRTLIGQGARIEDLSFTWRDDRFGLVSLDGVGTVTIFDARDTTAPVIDTVRRFLDVSAARLAANPAGRYVAMAQPGESLRVLNLEARDRVLDWPWPAGAPTDPQQVRLAFADDPAGWLLLTAGSQVHVLRCDFRPRLGSEFSAGRMSADANLAFRHNAPVVAAGLARVDDLQRLVTLSRLGVIRVWEIEAEILADAGGELGGPIRQFERFSGFSVRLAKGGTVELVPLSPSEWAKRRSDPDEQD